MTDTLSIMRRQRLIIICCSFLCGISSAAITIAPFALA